MQSHISDADIKWFRSSLQRWGRKNYFDFPWRSCQHPIHQLMSEILLQRTKAEQVVPVFQEIIANYPNLESLALLSEDDFSRIVRPLGLHWRAPLLYKLVQIIKIDFKGRIPEDEKELEKLPGIGQYVATAYLSLHRNKRAPIVDSNVVRLYARFFGCDYNVETRRKKWIHELANKLTPFERFREYNYAVLDFSRSICKKAPLCISCPLRCRCRFTSENW